MALSLWSDCSTFKLSLCLVHPTIPKQNSLTLLPLRVSKKNLTCRLLRLLFPTLVIYLGFSSFFLNLQWIHGFCRTVFLSFPRLYFGSVVPIVLTILFKYVVSSDQIQNGSMFFFLTFCLKRFLFSVLGVWLWIVFLSRKATSNQTFGFGLGFTEVTPNIDKWGIILEVQVLKTPSKIKRNK